MTLDTDLVENGDATFSVYTAPKTDDGAFVLIAAARADGLNHCIRLIDHYGLTKDIAGHWRVRIIECETMSTAGTSEPTTAAPPPTNGSHATTARPT